MRIEIHTPDASDDRPGAWNAGCSAVVLARAASSEILASCALWTRSLPLLHGKRPGFIGRYECADGAAGVAVLEAACQWLAREGCEVAVGPLDGSTWHGYRLVTESSPEAPFAMEPTNPPEWPELWRRAGFSPLASYHSSLSEEAPPRDHRLEDASARVRAAGLSIRSLDLGEYDRELRAIFELSLTAFADNMLYAPISWDEFAGIYAARKTLLDPRLVLLCEDPARPASLVGFILAFPDVLEHARTGACGTVILKSMGVHPAWRSHRLGTLLITQVQANARAMGMTRSIFALMHDDNPSARIARHGSRVIRRYTLFARELAP